jgi:hypothetical protein
MCAFVLLTLGYGLSRFIYQREDALPTDASALARALNFTWALIRHSVTSPTVPKYTPMWQVDCTVVQKFGLLKGYIFHYSL